MLAVLFMKQVEGILAALGQNQPGARNQEQPLPLPIVPTNLKTREVPEARLVSAFKRIEYLNFERVRNSSFLQSSGAWPASGESLVRRAE